MENYNQKVDNELLEIKKDKETTDKVLLKIEIVIAIISFVAFFNLLFLANIVEMYLVKIFLFIEGGIILLAGILISIKIEQIAGYYECNKCHFKYVPKYINVLAAHHIGRSRYMRCPYCNQKSLNKKVISK